MKKCINCGIGKDLSDFYNSKLAKDGHINTCKYCKISIDNKRIHNNPDIKTNNRLKREYGITLKDYDNMVVEQDGKCAICLTTEHKGPGSRFAVDHCHKTGVVRGLLCGNCNKALGLLNDDIDSLLRAISYLNKYR